MPSSDGGGLSSVAGGVQSAVSDLFGIRGSSVVVVMREITDLVGGEVTERHRTDCAGVRDLESGER